MFTKFGQYAASRFGMQECDLQLFCSETRSLVYQADAFFFTFSQSIGHTVFDAECHMMYATASFFEEFGDGLVGSKSSIFTSPTFKKAVFTFWSATSSML